MTRFLTSPSAPGVGPGWDRLARAVRDALPAGEIDGIWAFRVVRREGKDFGTAILSRLEADRRRIYTARFVHTVKGPGRGAFEWDLAEVGSGPPEALEELLAQVPHRAEDEEPPAPVDPAAWFPDHPSAGTR
jgi:hypothetical protein